MQRIDVRDLINNAVRRTRNRDLRGRRLLTAELPDKYIIKSPKSAFRLLGSAKLHQPAFSTVTGKLIRAAFDFIVSFPIISWLMDSA